jgi:dTDP-4-dehydrorhamnose reductase
MSKPVILVTGANGQLGKELRELVPLFDDCQFVFAAKEDLPIHDAARVRSFFAMHQPDYCVNAAAYTAVDKAESDRETAFAVNAEGAGILAEACAEQGTKFIHISTDYVFDGQSPIPYKEDAAVKPVNVYGASKLKGEELCLEKNPGAIIIRTAWVYSGYGHNFVKTMLRLMKERDQINVVNDQIGAPTYAADLAACIIHIISSTQSATLHPTPATLHPQPYTLHPPPETRNPEPETRNPELPTTNWTPGIYHFCNEGRLSWYEFAVGIKELTHSNCKINPITTAEYPTPARRPAFSLLDTHKIRETFGVEIPGWKDALERCLQKIISV